MLAEFRLLGEIEVLVDAQPVDLGHARQRSVLAVLLVDANRLVPTAQLVDRVWGEQAPPRARNALYGYIHHLRNALAGAADIQRKEGGYHLEVDAATVDLHRFRAMVAEARTTEDEGKRLSLLEQALGLWRGEAFAGASSPWLATVTESLERDRLEARLEYHDLALRHDRHAEILPGLLALAEEHPLDERIAGQLMLAQHRSGRSAAALDHYHRLRRRLADELGVDPGARVQEVFHLLLASDEPADPAPAQTRPVEQSPDLPPEPAGTDEPKPRPLRSRTGVIVSIVAIIVVMAGVLVATQVLRREEPTTSAGPTSAGSTNGRAVEETTGDAEAPPIPAPGVYDFQLAHSGLCMSEKVGEDSGQVFQSDCGSLVPVYSLEPLGRDLYHIVSDHPDYGPGCMGIPERSLESGAGAYDGECNVGAAEEFRVEPVGSPTPGYRLRADHSDLCLTAHNGSRDEWTPILQLPCDAKTEGQVFELVQPVS